jgi:hypothetical protein
VFSTEFLTLRFATNHTIQSLTKRKLSQGDSATDLAERFFTTLDSLQSVNPDIALDKVSGFIEKREAESLIYTIKIVGS